MLQKLNHQPNPSNMNNWTISRRVIAGFAAMLLIIVSARGVCPVATDGPRGRHR